MSAPSIQRFESLRQIATQVVNRSWGYVTAVLLFVIVVYRLFGITAAGKDAWQIGLELTVFAVVALVVQKLAEIGTFIRTQGREAKLYANLNDAASDFCALLEQAATAAAPARLDVYGLTLERSWPHIESVLTDSAGANLKSTIDGLNIRIFLLDGEVARDSNPDWERYVISSFSSLEGFCARHRDG